jgi:hypothetical protein
MRRRADGGWTIINKRRGRGKVAVRMGQRKKKGRAKYIE